MLRGLLQVPVLGRIFATTIAKEVTIVKRFNQEELDKFSKLTGDFNPIHSSTTPASERMVHGALLNAVVAGIIGTKLPGPGCIVLEQQFSFPKPCKIEVDAEFKVRLLQERKIMIVAYQCIQGSDLVLVGEAKLMLIKKSKK